MQERGAIILGDPETVKLKVRVKNAAQFERFALNDQEVFLDAAGVFEMAEELPDGANSFLLSAVDERYRFSFRADRH